LKAKTKISAINRHQLQTNLRIMKKFYPFFLLFTPLFLYSQSFPIAIDDSAQVMNQKLVEIFPLLNDHDPDGDTLRIYYLGGSGHGDAWYEDSTVFYRSEWFEGWEDLRYKVAKVNAPGYQSEFANIMIEVLPNPDVPVAVDDSLHARFLEPTNLDIMANDYDPNGDEIKIGGIIEKYNCSVVISPDSTQVTFTSGYGGTKGRGYFFYELRERSGNKYYSNKALANVFLEPNPDLPVAVNDSFEATGGITRELDILANDHNPLGDTLVITITNQPNNGSLEVIDNLLYYTAGPSYTGQDRIDYKIHYKNNPGLYSKEARVSIQVEKNPDCPNGEPDYGSGMAFTPITVEVLSNDHDPSGDPIEIFDVKTNWGYLLYELSFSGDSVTYMPPVIALGEDIVYYRIRKINHPQYYSDWIPIIYDVSHNPDYPLTIPDSASVYSGMEVLVNFRSNDIIHDTIDMTSIIVLDGKKGKTRRVTDSILSYVAYARSYGRDTVSYTYYNYNYPAFAIGKGYVYIDILNRHAYDSLTINNINAGVSSSNVLFSSFRNDGVHLHNFRPHFEAPKGSGKHTIFLNNIWLGGKTADGNLHLAGQRYRQVGQDIQGGPMANLRDSAFTVDWDRTWKLTRQEVEQHRQNWWKEGYEPPAVIAGWPGNGDAAYGMPEQMAPYHDHDGNGIYDPAAGDYPYIRGDECIYFICNDDMPHTESHGDSLQLEIHCMVYAFDAPDDSILKHTVFVHYDLVNRSANTYYDTYFGVFTDFDLGYEWDDYVGSHVTGNSYFCYNGTDVDGSGEPEAYGSLPPAQSATILAGPFMDPDQEDNPDGGCDFSVNGLNFGNGIVDDERYGLSYFVYFNSSAGPTSDPQNAQQYYQYMQGRWQNDSAILYGNNGIYGWADGPACRYMFPGDTDPLNWGTACEYPNGGWNQNGKYWTEEASGSNPNDRRGMGSCGPFTFHPGEVQEVDMAFVWANSYHNADSSKNLLKTRLDALRQKVLNGEIIIPNEELNIRETHKIHAPLTIWPNPARDIIQIKKDGDSEAEYHILNTLGTIVQHGRLNGEQTKINISGLKKGFYLITITDNESGSAGKLIKY
jgi:hypothetical protein